MRIGHIADCHIGYRSGERTTAGGVNVREQDVADAFRYCVDGILTAQPDAVLIAGDFFHSPRPLPSATVFAFQQLRRLCDAGLPVVLIPGNHDTSKSAHTGAMLPLFREAGVDVVTGAMRRVTLPGLIVTAVPWMAVHGADTAWMQPSGEGRSVLLVHGMVEGTVPQEAPAWGVIPKAVVESEAWDYIALGDWHETQQMGPRAWYAGSIGYTSSNIWRELATPKAWLLVDLNSGSVEPQLIPQARAIHDLGPLDARDLTAAAVQQLMTATIEAIPGGLAGAIVRLTVIDVPREVARQLDHAAIRKWKATALSLNLDLRKPETRQVGGRIARFTGGRRKTLPELVSEYIAKRVLPPDMDRAAFLQLGADAMSQQEEEPVAEKVCI